MWPGCGGTFGDGQARARVLVTGGAGFIGSHLVDALLESPADVVVLDDLSTGHAANLPAHPRLSVVHGSVTDRVAVERAAAGADLVLHLAGLVGVQRVHERPEESWRVAVHGTENVLRATGEAPVVLFSSSTVYGPVSDELLSEARDVARTDALAYDGGVPAYATGKWDAERLADEASARGRAILVVRPFNVVGPRQRPEFGMVLPRFVEQVLAGEPLRVFDDGRQQRTFADVEVFVATLRRLMSAAPPGRGECLVVNLGSPHETSVLDLARSVCRAAGARELFVHQAYSREYPGRRDLRARRPDLRRLTSRIGPVLWPDLDEVVRTTLAWRLNCRQAAVGEA